MPKRNDIHKILIIGSGPIIIGQACEFDYSGTQACKALKSLGYEIVLVNSNPATIMTDPATADVTYIEPLNVDRLTEIIDKERPDALLPNLGGQSGLNLCEELYNAGVLEKYKVEVIGVQVDAINRGEDRIAFKEAMSELGIEMAKSAPAYTVEEAVKIASELGYPCVIRPAYTMGGTGGGIVYNEEELRKVAARGIAASMVNQILIEESVIGWEELEVEVVRDATGKKISICFIENIDPMGVHTGDSFCSAPMLTISQEVQDRLEKQAHAIVESIGVIGGTNVQFAHDPKTDRIIIIEINPRTSRSSALASKATGFPIAYVSALLAAGLTLSEIPYYKGGSLADYKPCGDYVVVKFARWAFEKFKKAEDKLGTQMKAVGEVMSIGKNYKEALQKAIRSLEKGRYGLGFAKDFHELSLDELYLKLSEPTSERQFILYEAIRKGAPLTKLHEMTRIKMWFLEQMKELVDLEEKILACRGSNLTDELLIQAKKDGFSDKYLAQLLDVDEWELFRRRESLGMNERWDAVPVSGVEEPAAYYYSTYNGEDQAPVSDGRKVMVLGGGPNRIGQGIEFDYCCVHAAFTLRDLGFETIMVNCNPETVSTDYDTSDKLYFEPLTVEDVMSIYNKEKPLGVIVQFGGQTPLNIAAELERRGAHILGTSPAVIDMAEDRDLFNAMMKKLDIPMPESGMAVNVDEALEIAHRIGYPMMVRPSYVLGGRGMEVVYDDNMLRDYMAAAIDVTPERPILMDRFLQNALECETDAISDGSNAFVPTVMQHIEQAGVHSGDSACVIPSVEISEENKKLIRQYTTAIACEMGVVGLMNMQYAICEGKVYVLEANPRASRTVPLVSKVCNINMANIATKLMTYELTGECPDVTSFSEKAHPYYGVKEAVFPFNMFPEVDPLLGPEMRSTGEVLGLSESFGLAYYKAQEAAGAKLPLSGNALVSVNKGDRVQALEVAKQLHELGFTIVSTEGCGQYFTENGVPCRILKKLQEGRPNIYDAMVNGEVDLIVNSPAGKQSKYDDSYLRKTAINKKIPYLTTMSAALASAKGIAAVIRKEHGSLKSLQEYHKSLEA
ncbi:carbamoyl-phosphate synthase large subunit [Blautia pseudococcoides]|uniref:carbamoyl-phosphate synthase large subunit n=1 Tax=Blautia pseudococcoides TaxID=1796616 RepID=UPI00148AF8A6|nr:carbamoyl-phosphate synthase large subunit [Blautia pseudococcoides]QJU14735.1 carbamoyl-phosphate synthase large subunit [Blautia pseudococcoides]